APASVVRGLRQPVAPERHRTPEKILRLLVPGAGERLVRLDAAQHEGRRLPLRERELCGDAALERGEWHTAGQVERASGGEESHTVLSYPALVRIASVVE